MGTSLDKVEPNRDTENEPVRWGNGRENSGSGVPPHYGFLPEKSVPGSANANGALPAAGFGMPAAGFGAPAAGFDAPAAGWERMQNGEFRMLNVKPRRRGGRVPTAKVRVPGLAFHVIVTVYTPRAPPTSATVHPPTRKHRRGRRGRSSRLATRDSPPPCPTRTHRRGREETQRGATTVYRLRRTVAAPSARISSSFFRRATSTEELSDITTSPPSPRTYRRI